LDLLDPDRLEQCAIAKPRNQQPRAFLGAHLISGDPGKAIKIQSELVLQTENPGHPSFLYKRWVSRISTAIEPQSGKWGFSDARGQTEMKQKKFRPTIILCCQHFD
jgi:hypothetical protein